MKYTKLHAAYVESDIHQHLMTLYRLVVDLDAREVIECGVRGGESTVALLEGVWRTGGRLASVDVAPCTTARAMIADYELDKRWQFWQMDDLEFARQWDASRPVDVVFIDTSHEYEHTKAEIMAFIPLVRKGGAMAFHDSETCPGVARAIHELMKDWPKEVWKNNNGLTVARKP